LRSDQAGLKVEERQQSSERVFYFFFLGTTIAINAGAFAETSTACTSTRVPTHSSITADVPSTSQPTDIASGPHEKSVQPSRSTGQIPSTLVGIKKRSFNPDWFKLVRILCRKRRCFASHAATLVLEVLELRIPLLN